MRFFMWCYSMAALLAVMYVFFGYDNQVTDWQNSRIVLHVDPERQMQNAVAALSDEDWRQIDCLARNMYFEARDQGRTGMKMVTDVVFNRMESGLFPDQACQVITQSKQFSWVEDGRRHVITDNDAWQDANEIALNEWLYHEKMPDATGGALRYMNKDLTRVRWKNWFETIKVGAHTFYRGT